MVFVLMTSCFLSLTGHLVSKTMSSDLKIESYVNKLEVTLSFVFMTSELLVCFFVLRPAYALDISLVVLFSESQPRLFLLCGNVVF